MKVLLVQASTMSAEGPIFPIGLSYVGTAIKQKGHDVRIFDINTVPGKWKELVRTVEEWQPDVIGYSMRNIKVALPGEEGSFSQLEPFKEALRYIRRARRDVKIVAGGCAYSLYAKVFMEQMPDIDIGVFAEGEHVFNEVLENLDHPERVRGVFYRDGDLVLFSGHSHRAIDFHSSVAPDRTLVDIRPYLDYPYSIGVQTKRGCVLKCLHCSDTYLVGSKLRMREPKDVVDEVETLVKKFGASSVFFVDQQFNIPKEHSMGICEEIIRRDLKVKWTAWFNERGLLEEEVRLAKRAGCAYLSCTPDSANDDVLRALRKNLTRADLDHTIDIVKRVDMPISYNFFFPNPGETLKSFYDMMDFIVTSKRKLGKNFLMHGLFIVNTRVYPHSELHRQMLEEGSVDEGHDLVDPVYYDPFPMKYLADGLIGGVQAAYKVRQVYKRMFNIPNPIS